MAGTAGGANGESSGVQGGSVILDIGGDIGALIVYLPDSFAGVEINIGVADGSAPFTHTGVHPRSTPNGNRRLTAVYPELATGDYQLWHPSTEGLLGPVLHVDGGAVTELNLIGLDVEPATASHGHQHAHAHSH